MRQILLIMIGLSALVSADFTKTVGGNIVTDNTTGLQWQDDATGSTMSWESALSKCGNLSLDGYDDWRLPNINELKSIIDRSKVSQAIVDGFEFTSSNYYWSSTTYEGRKDYAWYVYFSSGVAENYHKYRKYYVRCVRAGQ